MREEKDKDAFTHLWKTNAEDKWRRAFLLVNQNHRFSTKCLFSQIIFIAVRTKQNSFQVVAKTSILSDFTRGYLWNTEYNSKHTLLNSLEFFCTFPNPMLFKPQSIHRFHLTWLVSAQHLLYYFLFVATSLWMLFCAQKQRKIKL